MRDGAHDHGARSGAAEGSRAGPYGGAARHHVVDQNHDPVSDVPLRPYGESPLYIASTGRGAWLPHLRWRGPHAYERLAAEGRVRSTSQAAGEQDGLVEAAPPQARRVEGDGEDHEAGVTGGRDGR